MKTALSWHKVSIISVVPLAFIIVAIAVACKKQAVADPKDAMPVTSSATIVVEAKSYFTRTILKNESDLASNKIRTNAVGSVTPKLVARMGKINPLLNWDKGFEALINGTKYLFIPSNEDIKPFKNKDFEFFRYLVFFTNASGKQDLSVLEILGDAKQTLGTDHQKTALTAMVNKLTQKSDPLEGLNASILFFKSDYSNDVSFHVDNGKWNAQRITFRSDMEIRLN